MNVRTSLYELQLILYALKLISKLPVTIILTIKKLKPKITEIINFLILNFHHCNIYNTIIYYYYYYYYTAS